MKRPLIGQCGRCGGARRGERGVTLVLVAVSLVAIMAMAALSIDVSTLYLASAEAQRAADAAALAGARVLSLSGMTGDPANSADAWPQVCTQATEVATAVATQNTMRGAPITAGQVTVSYLDKDGNNCASSGLIAFGLNPQVKVKIQRNDIPLYFAPVMRAFYSPGSSRSVTVSATATAEVFNPSASLNFSASGLSVPVKPRCVKPWIVPNLSVGGGSNPFFVDVASGSIVTQGINPVGGAGLVGKTYVLQADCGGTSSPCAPVPPLRVNDGPIPGTIPYIPADAIGPYVAVPVGATGSPYQQASGGCDAGVAYACGTTGGANADLTVNPSGGGGDTSVAVQSLTRLAPGVTAGGDALSTAFYPFRILAGTGNPLVTSGAVANDAAISASNSIVTLPIYDGMPLAGGTTAPPITIVGFLQVFITGVNPNGSLNVTILNVSGCGSGPTGKVIGGTSPVPVRLVQ